MIQGALAYVVASVVAGVAAVWIGWRAVELFSPVRRRSG
jgi:hypothetical protein